MDAQYPFASREDIWRVHQELKEIYTTQAEHGERLLRLERSKEDNARLKNVWGPSSQFPGVVGIDSSEFYELVANVKFLNTDHASAPTSSFNPAAEAFKSFEQGAQQHALVNNLNMESEEDPRRGASRANSVRFDESAIHGYYGQASRSTGELVPMRTGSGLGSHPLTERSLSHRSDGRQSSSGHSHHSTRTNSLGLETASRLLGSTNTTPPSIATPPAGLYILGPVPCIIRCWLTTNFSNDSLLYGAVCSGSFRSSLGYTLIRELGFEDDIVEEDGVRNIKLPVYLPEASMQRSSSQAESPAPRLPALTIQFLVHDVEPNDKSIQIFIGSDVLRAHNADILFSQDKIMMVDDERNNISIPLVRPENDSAFKTLYTAPNPTRHAHSREKAVTQPHPNGQSSPAATARSSNDSHREALASALKLRTSPLPFENRDKTRSAHFEDDIEDNSTDHTQVKSAAGSEASFGASAKPASAGVWGSWRRDSGASGPDSNFRGSTKGRGMKVLKPTKSLSSSSRQPSHTGQQSSENTLPSRPSDLVRRTSQPASVDDHEMSQTSSTRSVSRSGDTPTSASKPRSANPVGGASAFGWLNNSQQQK
ncbi:hypothetical protein FQN54_000747 [Arachnomyces sp. PD_36]|nr:hypothetical protein FQN54_000747 [Arachnomyces sp. PD_36]